MTRAEIAKLLNLIASSWRSFTPDREAAESWHEIMGDADYGAARQAIIAMAREHKGDKDRFAPTPGELLAAMPKGSITQEETVTWASDGASYTIERGGERHTYICAPPAEKWAERRAMFKRGYGYCIAKRPRGWASWYAPINQCREVGFDSFGGEKLPRFEQI